jgi:predicted membrane chloride channel (bestrophin family)
MAETMGWATVPVAIGLAFFLFGIEEIGVQIEE